MILKKPVKTKATAKKKAKKAVKAAAKKPPVKKKVAKVSARKSAVKKKAAKAAAKKVPAKKAVKKAVKKTALRKVVAKKAAPKVAKKAAQKTAASKKPVKKAVAVKKPIKKAAVRVNVQAPVPVARPSYPPQVDTVLKQLDDAKAENIAIINLEGKSSMADWMVIASGRSDRHVNAIANQVVEQLHKLGVKRVRVEGMPQCDWVLVDTGDTVVHVFRPEVRGFYNLEKLWSDAAHAEKT